MNRIKTFLKKILFKPAYWCLRYMVENKDPEIYGQIRKIADTLARAQCMDWLDARRLSHCQLCPTTSPLLKLKSGGYVCVNCAEALQGIGDEDEIMNVNGHQK